MPRNGRRDAVRNPPHPHLASSFLSSLFAGSSSKHNKQSLERIRNRSAHLDLVPLPSCPLAIDPPRGRAGSLSPGSPEDGEVLRRIGIQPKGKPRSVVKMPWNAHPPRPAPPRHATLFAPYIAVNPPSVLTLQFTRPHLLTQPPQTRNTKTSSAPRRLRRLTFTTIRPAV